MRRKPGDIGALRTPVCGTGSVWTHSPHASRTALPQNPATETGPRCRRGALDDAYAVPPAQMCECVRACVRARARANACVRWFGPTDRSARTRCGRSHARAATERSRGACGQIARAPATAAASASAARCRIRAPVCYLRIAPRGVRCARRTANCIRLFTGRSVGRSLFRSNGFSRRTHSGSRFDALARRRGDATSCTDGKQNAGESFVASFDLQSAAGRFVE